MDGGRDRRMEGEGEARFERVESLGLEREIGELKREKKPVRSRGS